MQLKSEGTAQAAAARSGNDLTAFDAMGDLEVLKEEVGDQLIMEFLWTQVEKLLGG